MGPCFGASIGVVAALQGLLLGPKDLLRIAGMGLGSRASLR